MPLSRISRKYSLVRRLTKALLGMDFKKNADGYVKVSELLAHDIFSSIKATEAEMKSLIELSEVFKTIQEILIDLNSGIKLNNKVQLKSLLMSLN